MEEAIRRREGIMVVIHGLGKSKLKQEIWKLLLEYTEVAHFDNDYDHRFGFGATLIEFGQR
ncbi:MAG: Smr/MutS family protein [Sphingobacteriales bacterium]|nr:Smr/MutS family protein [Sphingobacteriales bacterium]